MAALDVGEILGQLIIELLDDKELTATLGKVTNIFREYPNGTYPKPVLVVTFDNLNAQTQMSGTGLYRPGLTFDIFCLDPYKAGPVFGVLENNWSIPTARRSEVVSTNFRLDSLVFSDMIEVPGRLKEVETGDVVRQFSIPASSRVVKSV